MSNASTQPSQKPFDLNSSVVIVALIAIAALLWQINGVAGTSFRHLGAVIIAAFIGFTLYKGSFGFSAAFRALVERGDATQFRNHLPMLALASLIFMPLLAMGTVFGQPMLGVATPLGVSFVVGAVLFGIGMQLGGGCASGTLFALGGGNLKLAVTLLFFVVGSVLGAAHYDFWIDLPKIEAITPFRNIGLLPALAIQLLVFAGLWFITARFSHKLPVLSSSKQTIAAEAGGAPSWIVASWPALQAGIILALLNGLALLVTGQPWGETSAFALWGSKIAIALGFEDVSWWSYWVRPAYAKQLEVSFLSDTTSIMNIAIVLGATLAAGLSRSFELRIGGNFRAFIAAIIGGLLMGYGARLSYGCNIGAYFSGIASGTLSGWLWLLAALAGSAIGVALRPLFSLGISQKAEGESEEDAAFEEAALAVSRLKQAGAKA